MKILSFRHFLIGILLYFITCNGMTAIVVHNDDGQIFTLQKPAQRVISLSPGITELLFAAGGGSHLVGVIDYSDFPQEAKKIPVVGDSRVLDIERIILLKPDLILVWRQGSSVKQIEQLKKLNIPLFFIQSHRLDDIPNNIHVLGQLVNTETEANQAATKLRHQLDALAKQYTNRPLVRVFYQVWDKPLYTLNGEHIVSDAIRLCGGINIFSALTMPAPTVNSEAVLQADPEVIVATADKNSSDGGVAMWRRYPTMTAVKQNNLVEVDGDLMNRAGPRMISGVAALCEKLELARKHRH